MAASYRVWSEIDLDRLAHNLAVLRRRAGRGVRILLVVKADAYGHGAVAVAHHALRCGVAGFGVGTSEEALELRHAGIRAPTLVLGTLVDAEADSALRHDIHIGLHSTDRARMLQELALRLGTRARVHLNVDTGMGRLGVLPERALELLADIQASDALELRGVMTHVSSPRGALDDASFEQIALFERVLTAARARGLLRTRHAPEGVWIHAANSAAVFTDLCPGYDTVRPGISAYGLLPADLTGGAELEPVLSLKSQVVFLKDLPEGSPVGYSSTWRAARATRIATIPVGYNDGVAWRLSNRGAVLVRGRRAPIVGCVSMDYTTVDVGHIEDVHVGDPVTLVGCDGDERITLADVASAAGTIPYEISCAVGRRVRRVYLGGEDLPLPSQPPTGSFAGVGDEPERPGSTRVTGRTTGHSTGGPVIA